MQGRRMPRLACAAALLALSIAGCGGGDTKTVTETQAQTQAQAQAQSLTTTTAQGKTVTVQRSVPVPSDNQGPHYFETPSHNIGCYLDSRSVRCDIREHDWTAPAKPQYCIKAGVDWAGGVAVDRHTDTGHGFFLSRARYRLF